MSDPFDVFGGAGQPQQQQQQTQTQTQTQQPNGNEDPWANAGGMSQPPVQQQPVQQQPVQNNVDPWNMNAQPAPAMPTSMPPQTPAMQNGCNDPWANGQGAPTMQSQQQQPMNGNNEAAAMAPPQNYPWAPAMAPPQQPDVPPAMPPAPVDPWSMQQVAPGMPPPEPTEQPQENVTQPPAMPPVQMNQQSNMMQPNMQMQPNTEQVPATVVIDDNSNTDPPSPMGMVSVVGAQGGPEVPALNGQQPPQQFVQSGMMPIQEQQQMAGMVQMNGVGAQMMQQGMGNQMMQNGMTPQPMMHPENGMAPQMMPSNMGQQQPAMMSNQQPHEQQPVMPNQQPPQQQNAMVPAQQQDASQFALPQEQVPPQQCSMNTPTNPFEETGLTGQMNNLSMQNNGGNANGMPENTPSEMNGMPNNAPPMPPQLHNGYGIPVENQPPAPVMNGAPPMAPPPSNHPPAEPQMPPQQPPNAMEQAPLSPQDGNPFALSPGVALSPQVQDPFGYAFSPMTSPTEQQKMALPPAIPSGVPELPSMDPFGAQQQALVPSNAVSQDPFGVGQAVVPANGVNDDPFGVFNNVAPVNSAPSDPFASSTDNAMIPSSQPVDDDPFGIFGTPTPIQQPPQQPQAAPTQEPWNSAIGQAPAAPNHTTSLLSQTSEDESETPIELDSNGLPNQGTYYEARISARSLGAMFYTARDLENTLLYQMPTNVIDAMSSRPIVAYIAENSAAYNAGVNLGHAILSVNGEDVKNPDECAQAIRHASRPMTLRCYVMPDLEVTTAEGKHMVKYDKKDVSPPGNKQDWKGKYVVVGGIVSKPFVLNMYRSKAEYDIAVKETHSNYKCSVKVKQFDLRGARLLLRGKDGKPDRINYHNTSWHYITILPAKGYPIKISSERMEDLEPVYAAVRRFIRKDMQTRHVGYSWK